MVMERLLRVRAISHLPAAGDYITHQLFCFGVFIQSIRDILSVARLAVLRHFLRLLVDLGLELVVRIMLTLITS